MMELAPPEGRRRFIAGDPLRGIACVAVLIFHVTVAASQLAEPGLRQPGLTDVLGPLGPVLLSGALGFWFFFILSGYLLSLPFLRAVILDGPIPVIGRYARNRALRLVPAFWAALTVTIVVVGTQGNSLKQMIAFFGFAHVYDQGPFTPRMVQAWTLDVEMAFYIVMPLLLIPAALILRNRLSTTTRALLVLAGCAVVGALSIRMGVRGPTSGRCVPGSAWAFALGMALATFELVWKPRVSAGALRTAAFALVGLVAAAFVAHCVMLADSASGAKLNVASALICGGALAAPLAYQWATGGCPGALDNRPLRWFGERAYGVFLVHVLVIYELRHLTRSIGSVPEAILVEVPLVLAISTVLGALIYRFIERPLLERKANWRTAKPGAGQPALQQS
jgi:peptidoglycan/LPS O-acetylase OafA/YrhL